MKVVRNDIFCINCLDAYSIEKYNPYYDALVDIFEENESNTFKVEPMESISMRESMSNILEACQPFTIDEFNEFTSSECNISDRTFSCHFLNVDGNASNFDFLAAALHKVKFPFDVIGIPEINIKVECAHLYTLDGYSSLYQHKILRKKKGSGVAINEKHNYIKIQDLSAITSDIESIVVRITNSTGATNVGVVYRPPGGNAKSFNESLSKIMSSFKSCEKVFILGDFNFNLFNSNSSSLVKSFKEIFMWKGFTPNISINTQNKPNCRKSCIDNIFAKNIESLIKSSTIRTDISHHKSVFTIFELEHLGQQPKGENCITISYSYSEDNFKELNSVLCSDLELMVPSSFEKLINWLIFKAINFCTKCASTESYPFENFNAVNFIEQDLALFEIMRKNKIYFQKVAFAFGSILN